LRQALGAGTGAGTGASAGAGTAMSCPTAVEPGLLREVGAAP
jgi:hypothetical protein